MATRTGGVSVTVNIDQAKVDAFAGWGGPIGRSTARLARQVVFAQRTLAPKNTGDMARRINWVKQSGPKGIQFESRSPARQSMWMEHGTRPHLIRPKKAGGFLVFYWPKVGRTVFLRTVHHPGTRAYRFMERGLKVGMRIWQRTG
jgi:hypothetical protein